MKYLRTAVFLSFMCLVSSHAFAAVSLQLPDGVKVLAANEEKTRAVKKISLPDGTNQIAFQYVGDIKYKPNDSDMIYSDVFLMTFTAENERLEMKMPRITRKSQLDAFDRNPEIQLVAGSGMAVPYQINKLEKDGLQLGRDYAEEMRAFNATGAPGSVAVTSEPIARVTGAGVKPAPPKPISEKDVKADAEANIAEKMLRYWYEQADEETRARFREWMWEKR